MSYTSTDIIAWIKGAAAGAAGLAWAFLAPLMPYAELCTVLVLVDYFTARQLGRRLSRQSGALSDSRKTGASARFSSVRFRSVISTLVRIYAALLLSAAIQSVVVEGMACLPSGFNCVKFVTGVVCFWQLMSILENESTCSDARWARTARRYLADKARRHFDLPDDSDTPEP